LAKNPELFVFGRDLEIYGIDEKVRVADEQDNNSGCIDSR